MYTVFFLINFVFIYRWTSSLFIKIDESTFKKVHVISWTKILKSFRNPDYFQKVILLLKTVVMVYDSVI